MGSVEWPDPPVLMVSESIKRVVDFPGHLGFKVVSGRMRQMLERLAPDAAEYLPLRFEGPNADALPDTYWAINWLRVMDCLHETSFNVDRKGKRYVEVPVIDPAMIPGDFVLGIVKHFEPLTLIRNDLRLALNKAGITGTAFFKVASIDRPETITWTKVNWSKPNR